MICNIDLIKNLVKDEIRIWIYGTGRYAEAVSRGISLLGQGSQVCGFIESKKSKDKYQDKPVLEISEFKDDKGIVLIAVSKKYINEIKRRLEQEGLRNYKVVSSYVYGDEDILERYQNISIRKYLEQIAEGYIFGHPEYLSEKTEIRRKLEVNAIKRKDVQKLAFVMGAVNQRNIKLGSAIKKLGFQIFVIVLGQESYIFENEWHKLGIGFYKRNDIEEVIFDVLDISPGYILIDPPGQDASVAQVMLYKKFIFGKIIMAPTDVLMGVRADLKQFYYDTERYALERSAGIIWRYDIENFLRVRFGYQIRCRTVRFLEGCNEVIEGDVWKDTETQPVVMSNRLGLCRVFHPSDLLFDSGKMIGDYARELYVDEMIQLLEPYSEDVNLDLYVWQVDEDVLEKITEVEKRYSFVHIHIHTDHDQLMRELVQYDFALHLTNHMKFPVWPNGNKWEDREEECRFSEGDYKYAICNRFFEYLQAGIPIVASIPEEQCNMLADMGALLIRDARQLNIEELRCVKEEMHRAVKKARDRLCLNRMVGDLEGFFYDL